ncbi:MAG: sugar ABC transporter ATP-binding protein [Rhodothermaceae bacterium]|nr:sugar ABC transporter ATP-binding protein [Rhodothermaceae bacterium]
MAASTHPILDVKGITKRFPGVTALSNVDLALYPGEVLAVIGENGAGKSTLMKILAGVQMQDEGEILVNGEPTLIDSCRKATSLGISLIHQELNLSDNLSVGANIYLGREPRQYGFIDNQKIRKDAQGLLEQVGLQISSDALVSTLSIGQQQLVEIAKALSTNAQVLIMDEPTSSLSTGETERLFEVVRDLKMRGVSIIYISHRLAEVSALADRVLVLRDGENAGQLNRHEIKHDAMVQLMVGRDVSKYYARKPHPIGDVVLEVRDLITPAWPHHQLNFKIHRGEIVGISGLVGAGRTELLRVLFGVDQALGGDILIRGHPAHIQTPEDAINLGLALVPEERKEKGLIIDMTVRENIGLAGVWRHRIGLGALNRKKESSDTDEMVEQLRIKTPHADQVVRYLSGGNQQKVVLGKWLTMQPTVLLMDEPTRGIDIGAKEEVYKLMESLARDGMAILFVSSELEEILGMSDRALIMHEGRITGELERDVLTEETVMLLATGGSGMTNGR